MSFFPMLDSPLLHFSNAQLACSLLVFTWAGFVRSGLGFGGAALGLPLMLFIYPQPLFWLPVIGFHLLFFSALTLRTRLQHIDWVYLKQASWLIMPAALIGVLGLISLPNHWLLLFIYTISLTYACMWLFNWAIHSEGKWLDRFLLIFGGYVAGTSLTGAPLMVAVFMKNVPPARLRNTLFVLWFTLVSIKMLAFSSLSVPLQWQSALLLLPAAAIGHAAGLTLHQAILQNDQQFKRLVGAALIIISLLGLMTIDFGPHASM